MVNGCTASLLPVPGVMRASLATMTDGSIVSKNSAYPIHSLTMMSTVWPSKGSALLAIKSSHFPRTIVLMLEGVN